MIPVGMIEHNHHKDKYENDVSVIRMCDGASFNMVHHSKPFHTKKRFQVWMERGKFIRVEEYSSNDDCEAQWIKVGGYYGSWGDGDPLSFEAPNPDRCPGLIDVLRQIHDADFDLFIVNAISRLCLIPETWESSPSRVA